MSNAPESEKSSSAEIKHREVNNRNISLHFLHRLTAILDHYGVETHGIVPIPVADRTDTRWHQMFFVWFSPCMNVLNMSTGAAGPAFFSLGVRDSIRIIAVTDILSCLIPAFFAVLGPKLGMRAMVQSRFSWGYHGSKIPSILNVLTMEGYLVLNCILGGQLLASISPHLDVATGIVIISMISLIVTFFGYRFLHRFESIAWVPSVVAIIAMLALGYPELRSNQNTVVPAPTTRSVMSFASTVAASIISWCTMTPDYGVYHSPAASSARIFLYTYLGFAIPNIICHILGAAFAAAAPNVPEWNAGFRNGASIGGLIYGVLTPLGGFGKFLAVLIALTVATACAPTMYTFSTSLMTVADWFSLIPRWVHVIVSEGILIPLAIIGAAKFYTTFVDVINVIGYWSTAFASIIITEHIVFRGASFSELAYPIEVWDVPGLLPRSISAVLAFICACGALVPFMSQAWYVGPVAKAGSGDCGIYVAFVVSALCYAALRALERRWERHQERSRGVGIMAQGRGIELKV